jgi:nucleotide-binding universal stress UspA family protein
MDDSRKAVTDVTYNSIAEPENGGAKEEGHSMTQMAGPRTKEARAHANVDRDWLKARFKTVLSATDFGERSCLALDYAAAFARHFQTQLITVNAFELGPEAQNVEVVEHKTSRTRRDAEARLQRFTSRIDRFGISAKWVLVEGTVPKAILRAASESNAGLLVLGTRGVRQGLGHLLGSNTEALMLRSSCPTLTIGPHVHGIGLDLSFTKVIYISDFTPASAAAAPFARAFSGDLSADLAIYQSLPDAVPNDTERVRQLADEYCDALESLDPRIDPQWFTPEFQLSRVRPAEAILERATDRSALIVLGVQPASYLGRHLHTSFAYRLLANAACPILTVPGH